MTYDDLDEGQFQGVGNVRLQYKDCLYVGTELDPEGRGNGDLLYDIKGKSFAGDCENGKAKDGILNHTVRTPDSGSRVYRCEIRNFLPYTGEVLNERGGPEYYKNGKKLSKAHWSHPSFPVLSTGSVTLAALGAAYMLSSNPDGYDSEKKAPEVSTGISTGSDNVPDTNLTITAPVHDQYLPEGLSPEEVLLEYGDLSQPCSPEEELKIRWAQNWLDANVSRVDTKSDQMWATPENAWKQTVISNQVSFPDQYQYNIEEIYRRKPSNRFVCPGVSERYLGLSNFDQENSIAIYKGSLETPCRTVNTVLHEILHKNAKWDHPYASEFTQADWIYYAGKTAEDLCSGEA